MLPTYYKNIKTIENFGKDSIKLICFVDKPLKTFSYTYGYNLDYINIEFSKIMGFVKKNRPYLLLIGFFSFLIIIIFLRNNNLGNLFFSLFYNILYRHKIGHFNLMGILNFLTVVTIAPDFQRINPNQP